MEEKTPSKNPKLRQILIAVVAVVAALVFVVALVRRGGSAASGTETAEPYALDGSAEQVFRAADGRLAVASSSGLQIFDEDGATVLHEIFSLAEPGLTVGGGYAAAYDIGGTELRVARMDDGELQTVEPAGTIVSAALSESGALAVVTDAAGYKGMVTVYDTERNAVYEWYSGTSYVLNAALSPSGDRLAVLCMAEGGSSVHLFALNSETERGVFSAEGELLADLFWVDSRVCALSSSRLVFLSDSAEQAGEYVYDGMYLYDYAREGDGFVTLVLSQYRSGSAEKVVTVSDNGSVLGETAAADGAESVSACGKQVLLFGGGTLTLYNQQLEQLEQTQEELAGVRRALLLRRGQALLISDYSAQSRAL